MTKPKAINRKKLVAFVLPIIRKEKLPMSEELEKLRHKQYVAERKLTAAKHKEKRLQSELKRLTPQQSRKANALIKKTCCNCIGGNCILLDDGDECVCPQLISYSLLCRWFQNAVLPADKLLYAELYQAEDRRRCAECGAAFASTSNSVKYCPDCRKRITRRQAAERMRKRRARVTQ